MRKPIIAGNWKMHKGIEETRQLLRELKDMEMSPEIEVVVCPPFTSLSEAAELLVGTAIGLGAQNMHWERSGAYTGEVSPCMLKEIGCKYVIIGHSERRQYFGETDEMVNFKVKSAFNHDLIPIVCVGENLEQRKNGETKSLVTNQVKKALEGLTEKQVERIVIAYEPIWAIGTGVSAKGEDANEVIKLIRDIIAGDFGKDISQKVRIQYGGSVKPGNIKEFMEQPEIDGALVGGASLKAVDFGAIVNYKK
ncbi:Triosephosphate isomerase [Koleobacter methoxysyntrophicus]|jgi:triosephosphate isomerase|uniref:Triosephosphate isomerase n=1 Tax=Koleobacter methoxysyntrophicus TaxID=2751313 RepID=A0A8A0RTJ0_9FIRM|nr:triose-phosphate isomerase [Koleobacter methoxysyntrophicus]QSQ10456.1 Triosephosphate isomerase [Koleobacter methoxysyntrophicus]